MRRLLLAAILGLQWFATVGDVAAIELVTQLRRPVAIQLTADESRLLVANRDCGTISMIDTAARTVIGEYPVGKQLSDLVAVGDSNRFLATDAATHELLLIDAANEPVVVGRATVAPYPKSVVCDQAAGRAYVASLWSRQVTVVQFSDERALRVVAKVDLPFAARKLLLARNGEKLIVADNFSGRLAIIDTSALTIDGLREFPAHNIRGLGVTPNGKMLIVSHQMLNELANTLRNDVHWGLLMSNDLRWFKLDAVLNVDANLFDGAHMHPLGEASNATADPEDLWVAPNGIVVVTLGGVGEIAIGRENDFKLYRVQVGKRPVDVVVTSDGQTAYVANMFDDSVSIVDLTKRETVGEIPLGPRPKLTLSQRGETLFHDGNLSHDGWMTCNSCHAEGHTNGFQNDNFSDQTFGAPKRVLSLLGVKDTAPYAWNGGVARLEDQIRNSIEKTMQCDFDAKPSHVEAIAAYLRTLEPPPSVDALRGRRDDGAIERGEQLFSSLQCDNCHAPPLYTTPDTYDVGLADREGNRQYNPPSLRGLSHRGPYLHDDQSKHYDAPPQARQLDDVFVKFRHQLDRDLSADELRDLLAFLRSL